jgi:type IX secretion system PorP/SprF family membrane protein
MRKLFTGVIFILMGSAAIAQDPHFTQYYAAPLSINPAYTGIFNGKARFLTNHRQQWAGAMDPFVTSAASMDVKLTKGRETGQNPFNIGVQLLSDRSFKGSFRSSIASGTASFHVPLDIDGKLNLGVGLGASFASRKLDLSDISFDAQFASGGFDLGIFNGETNFKGTQTYFAVAAGALFTYNGYEEGTFFELGASMFNVNRPQFSFLQDSSQLVPIRYSLHASCQKQLGSMLVADVYGVYQNQATVSYIQAGLSLARNIGQAGTMQVGAGVHFRSNDAISPAVTMSLGNLKLGLSYDVVTSALKESGRNLSSMEFSAVFRIDTK